MNTAASLTVGLSHGSELWGMLVCHHATPRCAGFELRAAADLIGLVVSLLLVSTGEAEVLAQRLQRGASVRALAERLAAPVPLLDAFESGRGGIASCGGCGRGCGAPVWPIWSVSGARLHCPLYNPRLQYCTHWQQAIGSQLTTWVCVTLSSPLVPSRQAVH